MRKDQEQSSAQSSYDRAWTLVHEQMRLTDVLEALVRNAIDRMDVLSFPLGFPSARFDHNTANHHLLELIPFRPVIEWHWRAQAIVQKQDEA